MKPDKSVEQAILKYVLKNAVDHNGAAQAEYIPSKLIGEMPELRKRIGELMPRIEETVSEVNSMEVEEQESRLREIAPEMLEEPEQRKELPELPGDTSEVVVRLPPGPEKYPHIGHAFSFMINHLYAQRYNGKVWLRFEDTNPEKCKVEFYDAFKRDLEWLGIGWDHEKNESDSLDLYYERAEKLIRDGNAYVCTCDVETVRKNRRSRRECACRKQGADRAMELWKRMFSGFEEGEAQLRLKGDMKSKYATFRDPMLFRINETAHCLTGNKYRVWPGYDFANTVEDSECGITHVIRSNEFATRLQKHMRELLGYKKQPEYVEYTRYNVIGAITKGREIRRMIKSGDASGWDDPKLVTIAALRRRGIVPETFKELIYDLSLTKSKTNLDWDKISSVNRSIIDPTAKRYFFVPNPVRIKVEKAPEREVELDLHPDNDLGTRRIKTSDVFYVPEQDLGHEFRLKDLYNVRMKGKGEAVYAGDELTDIPKIQWVTEDNVEVKVLKPDAEVKGLAEKAVENVEKGEIVQFERFGFCRKDSDRLFVFGHS